MDHQMQLSLDLQSVAERADASRVPVQSVCAQRWKLARSTNVKSNVVLFSLPQIASAENTHSDLIGRILKSVRFYG